MEFNLENSQPYLINNDAYDRYQFDKSLKINDVDQIYQVGIEKMAGWKELMQDEFTSFYRSNPVMSENVNDPYKKMLLEEMMNTDQYKALRNFTTRKEYASAMATADMSDFILQKVPEEIKQDMKNQADNNELKEKLKRQIETLDEMFQKGKEIGNQKASQQVKKMLEKANQKLEQVNQQQAKIFQKLNEQAQKDMADMRWAIRKQLDKTKKDIEKTDSLFNVFGIDKGEEQHNMDINEKVELAKMLKKSSRLIEIAKLAGRFQQLAMQKQKTKYIHGVEEIVDIEIGSSLSRVLPSELLCLKNKHMKYQFYRKYIENRLMQYKLQSQDRLHKGPIIMCVDNSGSMRGDAEIWSKAVMLAIVEIAKKQKRDFAIVHFDTKINTFEFDKKKDEPKKLIKAMTYFSGGGTEFEPPLKFSLNLIDKSKFNKADILFITDGESDVSDQFLKEFNDIKKKKEFSVYSILIQGAVDLVLQKFSDKVFYVNDLVKDEKIVDELYTNF